MHTKFLILFLLTPFLLCAQLDGEIKNKLIGHWETMLETSVSELKMILHISEDNEGELNATIDSPFQGAFGIETNGIEQNGDSLTLNVPAVGGYMEFVYVEEQDQLQGVWHQKTLHSSVTFNRLDDETAAGMKRPQEPKPPYPYIVQEVSFRNDSAGITLSGTLTLPDTFGTYPAVALVSGSGPQDRNEDLMGHKPFKVIADYLTRNNIAVLRYDDRGVGESEGFFATATTLDFATDAVSAIEFLEEHPNVKREFTGIAGHSEGGIVAPIAANSYSGVDFVIFIAAPAVSGDSIVLKQTELINQVSGEPDKKTEAIYAMQSKVFKTLRMADSGEWDVTKTRKEIGKIYGGLDSNQINYMGFSSRLLAQLEQSMVSPWMRFFATYDPKADLRKLNLPVLVIYGENDLQVPLGQNLIPMENALKSAPTENFEIRTFEGLNHLMQPSDTGLPSEYATISTTFSEEVLKKMGQWIILNAYK